MRGLMKRFSVLLCIGIVSGFFGCISFPKQEAEYKAKKLEEQGYHQEADRIRRQAEEESDIDIYYPQDSDYAPQNDPYHFPELQVPPKERKYEIKYSCSAPKNE